MICTAYFGELSEERKANWNYEDSNPYKALEEPIFLEAKAHALLYEGSKYFSEQIQIDWGSFAWKCTPEEVYKFLNDSRTNLSWLISQEDAMLEQVKAYIDERGNTDYGIVFIEVY